MSSLRFKQVDVFTQKPFSGNPVAVVLDADTLDTDEMQRIAAWTNLSETTFVLTPSSAGTDYRLRIFTPKQELPFAGHPTIGSAHAVLESGFAAARQGSLRQQCLAGVIDIKIEKTQDGDRIFIRTPQAKVSALEPSQSQRLTAALGAPADASRPPLRVDVGVIWLIADLGDGRIVDGLNPDLQSVLEISGESRAAGVTVFGLADNVQSRMHVRSFAPAIGVREDPVCGSGNATDAAYLIHTGLISEIGTDYTARQGMNVGRDGLVAVKVDGDEIRIGGYAVTCIDGILRVA
jgi:PhzF family phenazine biosynthesis protein